MIKFAFRVALLDDGVELDEGERVDVIREYEEGSVDFASPVVESHEIDGREVTYVRWAGGVYPAALYHPCEARAKVSPDGLFLFVYDGRSMVVYDRRGVPVYKSTPSRLLDKFVLETDGSEVAEGLFGDFVGLPGGGWYIRLETINDRLTDFIAVLRGGSLGMTLDQVELKILKGEFVKYCALSREAGEMRSKLRKIEGMVGALYRVAGA